MGFNTIYATRMQFPILAAPAITIHKIQGQTEEEIVFNYDENMKQDLVYVGMSRSKTIDGLFIVSKNYNKNKKPSFKHGQYPIPNKQLKDEIDRLNKHHFIHNYRYHRNKTFQL